MSHNEASNFLRLGRKLERADKTSRILDVKYYMLLPSVSARNWRCGPKSRIRTAMW